jgi:hypothetical protein
MKLVFFWKRNKRIARVIAAILIAHFFLIPEHWTLARFR